jgi:type 1 glutamine amidotransferase
VNGAVNNPDFCRHWKSEMRLRIMIIALLLMGLSPVARADDVKPLTVLWCSGGGFHDYKNLTPLLTQAIQKYASVRFIVETDYKHWADRGFADKYDAVVYFFSYHDKEAKPVVENIAATIRAGKPALIIHGTLHSFRELGKDRDDFCEAIGLTSVKHDKSTTLATKKVADHPITRFWPDDWTTSKDELYQNVKLWPNAKPLMTCYSETSKKDHVVTWINQYGKARVFGTSLGHGKPTTDMETYHRLLANGLLWICDKLDDDGKPKPGYAAETTGAAR